MSREPKKPKTASPKGKRYKCAICRTRAQRKVPKAPYVCPACVREDSPRSDPNDHSAQRLALWHDRDERGVVA